MGALDRINTLGKRVPGFVWMMKGEQAGNGNTDAKIGGDPRYMSNLTVCNTVHRQFHQRLARCISCRGSACGHPPSLDEGLTLLPRAPRRITARGWRILSGCTIMAAAILSSGDM